MQTQHEMKIARNTTPHIPRYPALVDRFGHVGQPASQHMGQRLRKLLKPHRYELDKLARAAGLDNENALDRLMDGRAALGAAASRRTLRDAEGSYLAWQQAPSQDPGEPTIAVLERLACVLGVDPAELSWGYPLACLAPKVEGHSQFGSCPACVREFFAGERRSSSFKHRLQQAIDAYKLPGETTRLPNHCGELSLLLSGAFMPTIEAIERIACALNCSTIWLAWGWGPSGYPVGGSA